MGVYRELIGPIEIYLSSTIASTDQDLQIQISLFCMLF